ncbi:MAG TPA: ferrochelatase [Bryobacteraceae bacterium]|nr:ferrochelatase [Bryobacteraceae bacterium]
MKQAVLLLAHGAPERLEDIPEYLTLVRSGRPTPPKVVEEVRQRYAQIGGSSPMTARTREQAGALERTLGVPVYFGMRNWHPLIRETVEHLKADGIERIVALCLAPQYSRSSVGLYFRRTQEAKQAAGLEAEIIWTKTFHQHPLLIQAFQERLRPLLPTERVLFTAHSLPERFLERADPYDSEAQATARLVASAAGLDRYDFAYQSQGFTDDQWLGPTVESVLDRYADEGVKDAVLQPIGFVSDHVEVLYDVDVMFREYGRERGIAVRRPESLNASGTFIAALAEVAREKLCLES